MALSFARHQIGRFQPERGTHGHLTEEEVDAIREHEHVSETVALELGSCLIHGPDGQLYIEHMIVDDILAAQRRGDLAHAAKLKRTLRTFIETHQARPPQAG